MQSWQSDVENGRKDDRVDSLAHSITEIQLSKLRERIALLSAGAFLGSLTYSLMAGTAKSFAMAVSLALATAFVVAFLAAVVFCVDEIIAERRRRSRFADVDELAERSREHAAVDGLVNGFAAVGAHRHKPLGFDKDVVRALKRMIERDRGNMPRPPMDLH